MHVNTPIRLKVFAVLSLVLASVLSCESGAPPPDLDETPAASGATSSGRLVIVGGALQSENTPVYQAVLDGRLEGGPVCVLPTASGTPERSMEGYVTAFNELGGPEAARGILLTVDNPSEADEESVRAQLEACGGFFFTGGSQSRIVEVFRPDGGTTLALEAVRSRHEAGAVVSGSSAGAAIMTDPMIAGGSSDSALRVGLRSDEEGEGVWLQPGLGFLESGLIDQHFLARGRWGRLAVAVLNSGGDGLGFGIDENTALVVDGDTARVVGESGVIFLDARSASGEEGGTGGYGLRLFLLGPGDRVSLTDGEVMWDGMKEPLPSFENSFHISEPDLFARNNLLTLLYEFARAADPRVTLSQEEYLVEFRKEPGFEVLARSGEAMDSPPKGLSLGPVVLSFWRE